MVATGAGNVERITVFNLLIMEWVELRKKITPLVENFLLIKDAKDAEDEGQKKLHAAVSTAFLRFFFDLIIVGENEKPDAKDPYPQEKIDELRTAVKEWAEGGYK